MHTLLRTAALPQAAQRTSVCAWFPTIRPVVLRLKYSSTPVTAHSAASPCRPHQAVAISTEPSTSDAAPSKGAVRAGRRVRQQNEAPPEVVYTGRAVQAGRLPVVLCATFPDKFPTLSAARRVIRERCIHVDGMLGSCGLDVEAGQLLERLQALKDVRRASKREVQLQVAYEDDHLAVVVKPWGIKCYGDSDDRTIVGALSGALQPSSQPDILPRPQPVHRLDAAVGGLLCCAKTRTASKTLSRAFEERLVQKKYVALLCGRLEAPEAGSRGSGRHSSGHADGGDARESTAVSGGSIGTSNTSSSNSSSNSSSSSSMNDSSSSSSSSSSNTSSTDSSQTSSSASSNSSSSSSSIPDVHEVSIPIDGKPCSSYYRILGHTRSPRYGGWLTQVELWPHTGRKHQLRVHMAALGTPICGDGLRALSSEEHISNQGLYLEAIALILDHPVTGQILTVEVPEPRRFATLRLQQASAWNKVQQAELWKGKKAAAAAAALVGEPERSAIVAAAAVAALMWRV